MIYEPKVVTQVNIMLGKHVSKLYKQLVESYIDGAKAKLAS